MSSETIYTLIQVLVVVAAVAALWYLYRNFRGGDVFSRPQTLSRGQLKNIAAFARMMMKNTAPGSPRHEDAKRRHDAAQAELDRRSQAGPR
jgi:hypothetical protein